MSVIELLKEEGWDAPFFKVLANNDTGSASGHQGGLVIPQDLRPYFPGLTGEIGPHNPTLSYRILAELCIESVHIGQVDTRYQYQTWRGQRSPESRLTDNLSPLRNEAGGGDVLLVQRNLGNLDYYRLILVRRTSAEFASIQDLVGNRRWGALGEAPMSDTDLVEAQREEVEREAAPFSLFDLQAGSVTTTARQVARSLAFRITIQKIYDDRCAVCDTSLMIPDGRSEFEAAHIVPRSKRGSDDARNGLGLCRRHHWAFDNGLFGLDEERRVWVPEKVRALTANDPLSVLHGSPLREATDSRLAASGEAMRWHMENIVMRRIGANIT